LPEGLSDGESDLSSRVYICVRAWRQYKYDDMLGAADLQLSSVAMRILLFAALFFVLSVLAHPEKDKARSVGISISKLNEVRSTDLGTDGVNQL
jgi:hypothetical protein